MTPIRSHSSSATGRGRDRRLFALSLAATGVVVASSLAMVLNGAQASGGLALTQPPDPYIGSLTPNADADQKGMFSPIVAWPLIPIHASVMPNGDLLTFGAPPGQSALYGVQYDTWNPAGGISTAAHSISEPYPMDSFCSIGSLVDNGDFFVVGGNTEYKSGIYRYDTKTFSLRPELAHPRWYASTVRLPDDRMVIVGGSSPFSGQEPEPTKVASTPEIYTPGSGWTDLPGAASTELFGSTLGRWWYPRPYLAPDGTIVGVSRERIWRLDPNGSAAGGAGTVTQIGTVSGTGIGASTSSVMYAPGKLLQAGGGQVGNGYQTAGSSDARLIDINSATLSVNSTDSLAYGRNWLNLTVLANGEVLASGGTGFAETEASARLNVETWNPTTGQWRTGAAAQRVRTYHSTAVLLPSGAVFTGGSGGISSVPTYLDAEFFFPSSMFTRNAGNQVVWASRPEFRSASGTIAYGGNLTTGMKDARQITSVSLTTLGSVTHSVSIGERRVPLSFSQSGDVLSINLPTSNTIAPPGWYLLHAVDANGVAAPAQIIQLRSDGGPGTITVYGTGPAVPPAIGVTPTTQPATTTPVTTTPPTTQPATTTPPTTTPPTTQPATTQPATTQPVTTQPVTTQPVTTQPATTTPPTTTPPTTTPPTTPDALAAGLVARYRFDATTGATATDSSGWRNNATLLNGAGWATGKSASALGLSTPAGHARAANSTSLNLPRTNITVAAWVYPTKTVSGWSTIASRKLGMTSQWEFGLQSGRPSFGVSTYRSGQLTVLASDRLPTNRWSHVVGVYDGKALRIYVNGVEVTSRAASGLLVASARPMIIGARQALRADDIDHLFVGRIDDVRVYSRGLSTSLALKLWRRDAA